MDKGGSTCLRRVWLASAGESGESGFHLLIEPTQLWPLFHFHCVSRRNFHRFSHLLVFHVLRDCISNFSRSIILFFPYFLRARRPSLLMGGKNSPFYFILLFRPLGNCVCNSTDYTVRIRSAGLAIIYPVAELLLPDIGPLFWIFLIDFAALVLLGR